MSGGAGRDSSVAGYAHGRGPFFVAEVRSRWIGYVCTPQHMFGFLLRDVWFRLILLLWAGVALFYITPVAGDDAKTYYGDYLIGVTFLPVVIACCIAGAHRIRQLEERHFWLMVGGAYSIW